MNAEPKTRKNVFYIPAGVPFLEALANAILSGNLPRSDNVPPSRDDLPRWTILLPTRRATRALMQAFIDEGKGSALLLPRIHPLGDVDEDELALTGFFPGLGEETLPDAISGLERQFVLFDLIHNWVNENSGNPLAQMLVGSAVHAFDLARSLATLVDSFETNNVELKNIDDLFDGEFAEHRRQLLEFLAIVQKRLPEKMAEMQKIGPGERRNRLMRAHTGFLAEGKAFGPVIAAGSTGSIPATAQLLACIANMENGAVVLPGLDLKLDDESWDCLPENHPQFGMRELLETIGITRDDVAILPGIKETPAGKAKSWLASEIMRPADTTDQWRKAVTQSRQKLIEATSEITILDAEDQREESLAISLIMRNGLEEGKSVALVTPDRQLARNVKSEMTRWSVEIDDSAGEPLIHTPHATFLRLLLESATSRFAPAPLKALLAHPFSCFETPFEQRFELFTKFEIALLRTDATYEGLNGLTQLCQKHIDGQIDTTYAHPAFKRLNETDWNEITGLAKRLLETLQPLANIAQGVDPLKLTEIISCHLSVAELACRDNEDPTGLWDGDVGEKLSEVFSSLQAAAHLAPMMTSLEYTMLVDQQLAGTIVRPKHVRHGTLAIYGLLEARLISADVIVLAGLNETIWPPVTEVDPWLTRPQLRQAGLPVPERRVGLTAHDFAQGFCSTKVYLTYSKKSGNSPAVPSRWLLRLNALLKAADAEYACVPDQQFPWLDWARAIDQSETFEPGKRPSPTPLVKLRPVNFSVSGIATLLKDPYAFFANKILKLTPLIDLEHQAGAAEKGNLVHAALQSFIQNHQNSLPDNAADILSSELKQQAKEKIADATLRVFWQPQFARMAEWFIEQEVLLRENLHKSFIETSGQYSFDIDHTTYSISARADRLDLLDDQTVRIIDYKTGTLPALKETNKDFSPQLLLEAVISFHGGFGDINPLPASVVTYMKLSGGMPAGEVVSNTKDLDEQINQAEEGMKTLLSGYAVPEQPYMANHAPVRIDIEYEYDYLSRWREWAHLSDQDSSNEGGAT